MALSTHAQDIVDASYNTSRFVSYEATQRDLDFVLHFGDLGYALGSAWKWDAWGTMVADGASRVPYMVSMGNHGMWRVSCVCHREFIVIMLTLIRI